MKTMRGRLETLNSILHQWCPLSEREVALLQRVRGCRTRSESKEYHAFPVDVALARGLACEALYVKRGSPYRRNPALLIDAIVSFTDGKAFGYANHLLHDARILDYDAERVEALQEWINESKFRAEQDEKNK
ncbi:hypothetical protein HY492_01240 [Candidatus Woesearchaeota archaeon]|nr:hypothetical protein [Candidatus Woesearchaeota archaeon]